MEIYWGNCALKL